jgi:hypothetical protein
MVTKEQFLAYEAVRESGQYNMIMDGNIVMELISVTKVQYIDIIKNYSTYYNMYINS